MKFLRLALKNYRGIAASEVNFAPTGVTVVRGPNEIGKSSIVEALRVLFEYKDSSKHSDVMAIQPVDKDVGSEIELDVESGPYRFTYTKRFHRERRTTLRIDAPRRENLTGEDAHARANAILVETLGDDMLWKVLAVMQGEKLALPALEGQSQLSRCLTLAAGGARSGAREESLFDAANEEYSQYFTDSGRPKKELEAQRAAVEASRTLVLDLQTRLDKLELEIAESAALKARLQRLEARLDEESKSCARHAAHWSTLEALEKRREKAAQSFETAQARASAAIAELRARETLVEEKQRIEKQLAKTQAEISAAAPALLAAQSELEAEEKRVASARASLDASSTLRQRRARDVESLRQRERFALLTEKLAQIERERRAAEDAERVLATNTLSAAVLEELEKIARLLSIEDGVLALAAPSVRIEARAARKIAIDGVEVALDSAQIVERSVPRELSIEVPGVLSIQVQSGKGTEVSRKKRDDLREKFAEACFAAGVGDLAAARVAHAAHASAQATLSTRDQRLREILGGSTLDAIAREHATLRARIDTARAEADSAHGPVDATRALADAMRAPVDAAPSSVETEQRNPDRDPPFVESVEDAIALAERAQAAEDVARNTLKEIEKRVALTRGAHEKLAQAQRDRARDQEREARELSELDRRLAIERARVSDSEVLARKTGAEADVVAAQREHATAEELWRAQDAERARALLEGAQAAVESIRRDIQATQLSLKSVETSLLIQGELGLGEELDDARTTCERVQAEFARVERRARAAKTLFELLRDERAAARRATRAPLQEQITRLARIVFPGELAIELGEDLTITSRTSRGVTVPFESLSGGTREQLSILTRLAVAMIVSGDEGVPVVLDDTLGYTDEDRLERMGAALALAGKTCQVIVLTCVADRYRHVPNARLETLAHAT